MPGSKGPKTHSQARLHCCVAYRRGGAKLAVKPGSKLELMIMKYGQPSYDATIESYPADCCNSCRQNMYRCKKAEDSEKSI